MKIIKNNRYFILRHGGALSNKINILSCWPEKIKNPLTLEGEEQIRKLLPKLKKERIDLIFSSDLLRTKQTSQILAKVLKSKINFDKRLREVNLGIFNGKPSEEWHNFFKNKNEMFYKRSPRGENYRDIKKRIRKFLKEIDIRYRNKNILIIGHGDPLFVLQSLVMGLTEKQMLNRGKELKLNTGELRQITNNNQ